MAVVSPLYSFLSQICRSHIKLHTPPGLWAVADSAAGSGIITHVCTPGSAGAEQPLVPEVDGSVMDLKATELRFKMGDSGCYPLGAE